MHVGPVKASDGINIPRRAGWFGDQMVSDLNPKWFEWVTRGFGFIYASAAAGVTFAVAGNNLPTFWNPAGSGVLFVPLRVYLGYVSATMVAGHVAWASLLNAGSQIGTGAPVVSLTDITPTNALIGVGRARRVRFATTISFTAAPTYLRPAGQVNTLAGTAAAVVAPFPMVWDEDSGLVLAPGNALQLCANAAIAMVASVAVLGLEIPLPPGWEG